MPERSGSDIEQTLNRILKRTHEDRKREYFKWRYPSTSALRLQGQPDDFVPPADHPTLTSV